MKAVFELEIPISWETACVWMHALGFHCKAHSKNVHVDGHNRPDVLKWKEGYLVRQFEWADDAKSTPEYLKRANLYIQFTRACKRKIPIHRRCT